MPRSLTIFAIVLTIIAVFILLWTAGVWGEEISYWKVLLAEAANQGEVGMRAVACALRNRGTLQGVYGAQRKDLDEFCRRQGPHWIRVAKRIAEDVFNNGAVDITGGATLWENINRFGFPKDWDKSKIKLTVVIKNHHFFKEIK